MSVLGVNNCKFICEDVEVDLQHSILDPAFMQSQEIVHRSIINGTKNFITREDTSQFNVTIYLYKYDSPKDKFNEILNYKNQLVYFYPYKDGEALKDKLGNQILVYIRSVEPYTLFNTNNDDFCVIRFVPTSFNSYTQVKGNGFGYQYGQNYGFGL